MSKKYLINLMAGMMLVGMCGMAKAITWGERDEVGAYPNVVSVRGIQKTPDGKSVARVSCSGSLLHIDPEDNIPDNDYNEKVVILTAAHCTDRWIEEIAAGNLNSVGVSFDPDNVINGSMTNAAYYVTGGVPISMPEKDSPFEKFDYGFVVFPRDAIVARWGTTPGALTPVKVPENKEYLPDLINRLRKSLSFTAVGYGTGEVTGQANPSNINYDPFLIRHFADNLSYKAHNPVNDVFRLSQNISTGNNGTCHGDSGGPIFYTEDDGDLVQVSLTSGGDAVCRATTTGPGFSRQEAFDFVGCGKIPGNAVVVKSCVDNLYK